VTAVPVFEIGLCNAWLFIAYFYLHPLLMLALDPHDMMKKMGSDKETYDTKAERVLSWIMMGTLVAASAYSIGLPLRRGSAWFYVGVPIAVAGFVLFTVAMVNIARTPLGRPFTAGLYRYSRHPMNLWSVVAFFGVGIAAASWLFLLLAAVIAVCTLRLSDAEERYCLARYGDEYRSYQQRTPKYLGMPRRQPG
jgi:protein-S-isoprenylcysteine O-methyltransferase Ste14